MNFVAIVAAILMSAFVFLSAILRYLAGTPIWFSDELVGLLFLSTAFLAMPKAYLLGQHIRISLLVDTYPLILRRLCAVFGGLIVLTFCAVFTIKSWDFMYFSYEIEARSDIARFWLVPWMAIMPWATAILFVAAAIKLVLVAVGYDDPEKVEQS
jgi:TRAP-type C4-dicarboxylate transport system permease small subunit